MPGRRTLAGRFLLFSLVISSLLLTMLGGTLTMLSGHVMQDDTLVRLIAMPNVIVSSHQAFLTKEALDNIAATTVSNVLNYFQGTPNEATEVSLSK